METKKCKKYTRLELFELQTIFEMKKAQKRIREISRIVRRSAGTVSKALTRYCHPHIMTWLHMSALERAKYVFDEMQRNRWRSRQHGHIRDYALREYVIDKLVHANWTPEQISERVEQGLAGKHVSAKTIYSFTKKHRPDLKQHLREKGKARRQRIAHRRGRLRQGAPAKRSIHERPAEVEQRKELGHWEVDTIITKRGGHKAVLSLRERSTRQRIFRLMPDLCAATTLGYLRAILDALPPELRKSLTFDNGSEFAISDLIQLEALYPGLKLYYCDSYSSWQKGSVENGNRDFRYYYPKGTDFATLTPGDVRRVETLTNNWPLKCLKYQTANEAFSLALVEPLAVAA